MPALPATDLRRNLGTWAVPLTSSPAVGDWMTEILPLEIYDPGFRGQALETTYFDTPDFDLRRARQRGDRYLTLRLRRYCPSETWALSAKTEDGKFRIPIDAITAGRLPYGDISAALPGLLPDDLLVRLLELVEDRPLGAVVAVCFTRYSVEDDIDRLTFDLGITTDTGKHFPCGVLEHKSQDPDGVPLPGIASLQLRPLKLSKFLWATRS
jgi:hypothetical protein